MTSRERMLAAIRHQAVDRVPVSPWGFGHVGLDSPMGAELLARTDPWVEVGLGFNAVHGRGLQVEERHHGQDEEHVIHIAGRTLSEIWRTTQQTRACISYLCKTREDIDALLSAPYVEPQYDISAFRALKERVGEHGLVVLGIGDGLCYPNDVLGTEYCSLLWAEEPELIRHLVALAAERTACVVQQALEAGVDCVRIVGGEYATQLMGQRAWSELIVPYDGPLIEMIHAYGAIAHYHNHGNMQRFLEQIADLGIDSLDPIEQPPYGDVQMVDAQRRIGERVCLVGGLDDMEILETHDAPDVAERARRLLEEMSPLGFMLGGTSSGIYGEAAARNFVLLVDVASSCAGQ